MGSIITSSRYASWSIENDCLAISTHWWSSYWWRPVCNFSYQHIYWLNEGLLSCGILEWFSIGAVAARSSGPCASINPYVSRLANRWSQKWQHRRPEPGDGMPLVIWKINRGQDTTSNSNYNTSAEWKFGEGIISTQSSLFVAIYIYHLGPVASKQNCRHTFWILIIQKIPPTQSLWSLRCEGVASAPLLQLTIGNRSHSNRYKIRLIHHNDGDISTSLYCTMLYLK